MSNSADTSNTDQADFDFFHNNSFYLGLRSRSPHLMAGGMPKLLFYLWTRISISAPKAKVKMKSKAIFVFFDKKLVELIHFKFQVTKTTNPASYNTNSNKNKI